MYVKHLLTLDTSSHLQIKWSCSSLLTRLVSSLNCKWFEGTPKMWSAHKSGGGSSPIWSYALAWLRSIAKTPCVTFLGPMTPYLYAHVFREKICKVVTIERWIEIVSKSFWELHSLKCCDGWIVEGLQVKAEITVTQTLLKWTGKRFLVLACKFIAYTDL